MVNKNYRNGRNKEYRICNKLKKQGFNIAQRSAGSHSPIDVFAINKETKEIKFIQAKPKNYPKSQVEKLYQENNWISGMYLISFEVI